MYLKPSQLKEHHYMAWSDFVKTKGLTVHTILFEYDEHYRLHCHGIATVRPDVRLVIRSLSLRGYHTHIEPLKTLGKMAGWLKYITKEQDHDYYRGNAMAYFEHMELVKQRSEDLAFNFGDDSSGSAGGQS